MTLTLAGIAFMPIISNAQGSLGTINIGNPDNPLKIGGLLYMDYAYKMAGDTIANKRTTTGGKAPTTEYYNLPTNYSGFNIRRAYLNVDYDVTPRIHAEVVLAHESNEDPTAGGATSANGYEVLGDNNNAMYLKYANVRYKGLFTGTDLILGQQRTPTFATTGGSEPTWQYRSDERTITDMAKLASSTDLGIGLEGKYMNGDLGYNLLFGNNNSAKMNETLPTSAATSPRTYADVYYKFFHKLEVQLYADYSAYNFNYDSTKEKFQTSSSLVKLFVAYIDPKWCLGAEIFQQTNTHAVNYVNGESGVLSPSAVVTTAAAGKNTAFLGNLTSSTPQGISIFGRIILIQGDTSDAAKRIGRMQDKQKGGVLSLFARYDIYNPDGNMTNALASNKTDRSKVQSNQSFITAGLDWQIGKNIHIMPNFWYTGFTQKYDGSEVSNVAGFQAQKNSTDVVARLTVYYQFGN